jgi:hypothetical protein
MPLDITTLNSELEAMLDSMTAAPPAEAPAAWAEAFGNYFKGGGVVAKAATWTAVPVVAAKVDSDLKPAMEMAMTFPDPDVSPDTGNAVLIAGFLAFWGVIVAAPATYFPGMIVCVLPTGIAALDLSPAFTTNNAPGVTNAQAAVALAAIIHPICGLTGTGAIPPASPLPIA